MQTFKSGVFKQRIFNNRDFNLMHSFDECEKDDLEKNYKEVVDYKLRIRDVNNKLIKSNAKTFFCDICYLESTID